MSNDNRTVNIDLSESIWAIGIIILIILFAGEPYLCDALIYRLFDGQVSNFDSELNYPKH